MSEKQKISYKRYQDSDKGKQAQSKANKNYRKSSKGLGRHYKDRYGLTIKQREAMYIEQNGCCYICNFPIPYEKMDTDHNHQIVGDKGVRKLLCHRCNLFVGYMENSPELVTPILAYLEEHKGVI